MIILYGLAALGVYLIVYGSWLELIDDIESGGLSLSILIPSNYGELNYIRMGLK